MVHKTFLFKIVGLLVAAMLAIYAFSPLWIVVIRDDLLMFPERAYMRGELEWLFHSLRFPQTRLTWCGDAYLFRPLLFLIIWIEDVFFRTDRVFASWISGSSVFLTCTLVYFNIRNVAGKWLAFFLALQLLIFKGDIILAVWPHISPYVLAPGLLIAAFTGFDQARGNLSRERTIGMITLIVAAGWFHELVPVTLVLIGLGDFVLRRFMGQSDLALTPSERRVVYRSVFILGSAAFLSAAFSQVRGQVDPNEAASSMNLSFMSGVTLAKMTMAILGKSLGLCIPFSAPLTAALLKKDLMWSMGVIALLLWGIFFKLNPSQRDRKNALFLATPILALLAGLAMGRLRTRGYVEDYYYHLIALFLVPTLVWVSASVMTRVFTKIPRFKSLCLGAVCLLLGVTSLRQAQIHHAANSKNLEQTWFKHEMLKQAVTYFKQSSGSCYAGTTSSIPDLGREMDLLLYRQSCSVRQGTPWVVKLTPDYERKTVELTYLAESILEDPDDNRTTAEVTLSSPQEVVEPNLFDSFPQKNRYQAPFLISAHPPISIQVSDKIYTPHRLTAKLEIKETDAPMLGFGIATGIGEKWESVVSLTLINNEIYLRKGSATNPLAEARGIIQDFSKDISITLMQSDQRCRVFYNHALVAELLDCTFSSGKIAFFTMDNKTPAEELLDLRAD